MFTITKRSGLEEEYHADKIVNSMGNVGVSQETAEEIAGGISYRDGMTTSEVRNRVIGGIKNREPQAAKRYESHPKKNHNI
jgi:hypothetical protein